MKLKLTYFFILGLILLSSFSVLNDIKTEPKVALITTQKIFEAGNDIVLKISTTEVIKPLLYCANSYGTTVVKPTLKNNILYYKIPTNIKNKIGVVNWKLLQNNISLFGEFIIKPKTNVASMETYIGPPSIEAGETDFTMLVVIPSDSLDNPLAENTLINAKYQFLSSEKKETIYIKNLIAYKNIYSEKKSGRMLVSSESLGVNSKEYTIHVSAAIPTDFSIYTKRPHEYADGNQVTTFYTSIIKDKQNNVVSDGTFVTFFIKNKKENILKTTGTTISGIATSKMIHPVHEDLWNIKAYVDGMAESNTIMLNYKAVIDGFDVQFSTKNRTITIGPLQSFMKQMIPDGLFVKLNVYENNSLIKTLTKTSKDGFVNFYLKPEIFKDGKYTLKIETAGLEKKYINKTLW